MIKLICDFGGISFMIEKYGINSLALHIVAMIFMFIDHAWATVISGNMWMNFVGRLAFPIFAFMTAEGFFHTHNFKKYLKRLFILAILSEIPFNLMMNGSITDVFHQNVIWTFIISLLCLKWLDSVRNKDQNNALKVLKYIGISFLGFLIGTITMVDYSGTGVLTVILFYFFHGRGWKNKLVQLFGMYIINFILIQNMDLPLQILGHEFFFPTQGFAIFSLIFIWLYNGKQGPHNKYIQYFCYAFYPLHILILSLIAILS